MGEDTRGQSSGRRVTVDEAARALGLSVDAIRKRVQRGTIPHEKDAAGRVRIILDSSETLRDTDQDTTGHAGEGTLTDELRDRIHYLERQVEEEREARRRADTLLAQLMQRIPELEAPREQPRSGPSGARMSPETAPGGPGDAWDTWQEEPKEPSERSEPPQGPVSPGPGATPPDRGGEAHGAAERPFREEEPRRRPWWRFWGQE